MEEEILEAFVKVLKDNKPLKPYIKCAVQIDGLTLEEANKIAEKARKLVAKEVINNIYTPKYLPKPNNLCSQLI